MSSSEPILIWGAGAIGGTLGAYWARAGVPVLLVDVVAEHVRACRTAGLEISGPVEAFKVALPAVEPHDVTGTYHRIVLAVKAPATEAALQQLAPHLAPDGFVLSAQNGLNEIAIAEKVGAERTMGCFVNFGADWHGPGQILYGNRGAVVVGEIDGTIRARTREMHALLAMFEPDAVLTDNIWGYLWGKLAYGAMLFATALTNDSMTENFADPRRFVVFDTLGREVLAVAQARGVKPVGFKEFDPQAFAPRRRRGAVTRRHRLARRLHEPHGQDAFRHLARPRGEKAQDGDRPPDRRHRFAWPGRGRRDARDRQADRADPRHRGRTPSDVVCDIPGAHRHMHIRHDGRVALVTGAAQGIGQAIARGLRDGGAKVHVADLDAAGVSGFAQSHGFTAHVLDVSDRSAAGDAVSAIVAREGQLDILVNAAGGVRGQVGRPIEDIGEDDWRAIFQANVDGAFWLAQAAAPSMRRAGFGRIVNIASGAGLRPSLTGIQAYTAAKHALVGLTRQLSQDLGRFGITCNAVAPGFVRSNPSTERQWESYGAEGQARLIESIHTRRLGTADDIASAVLFLASEQAGWVSGQILSVDGGRS